MGMLYPVSAFQHPSRSFEMCAILPSCSYLTQCTFLSHVTSQSRLHIATHILSVPSYLCNSVCTSFFNQKAIPLISSVLKATLQGLFCWKMFVQISLLWKAVIFILNSYESHTLFMLQYTVLYITRVSH